MNKVVQSGKSSTLDLSRFNILVAEDYEFIQQLLTGMLKAFGVGGITMCAGGDQARGFLQMIHNARAAEAKVVDILLTDWMMPEGDGATLMKWVRSHEDERIKFMPVIMISAFANRETVIEGRDLGANEVLVKPISGDKLANRILNVINHPRPFIKAPEFFGPDRRRMQRIYNGADKRVTKAEEIKVNNEQP